MDDLSQRIARLSPAKRQLLERRLRQQGLSLPTSTAIPRRTTPGPWPLSFPQRRMWFLNQLEPDKPVYNEPKLLSLRGELNVSALHQALTTIVERHEVLRTVYLYEDDQPLQQVLTDWTFDLPVLNLQAEPDPPAALAAQLAEAIQRPFDLGHDLMMRGALYTLAPREHVLLLVTHHIALDGWSVSRLWRELSVLYTTYQQGGSNPLPPLPLQYADYAVWQREVLSGPRLAQDLAYWQAQLHAVPPLDLPLTRPRPAVPSYTSGRVDFRVDPAVSQALRGLSRREEATVFMTLLAAFAVLLHRLSGQTDFAVGTVIATRPQPELEDLLGFFVNTLVMRTDLADRPTFREVVRRVRETAFAAFEHQDVPFEKLVEELPVDRAGGRQPLFQTMFNMRNMPRRELDLPGLTAERLPATNGAAKFDLMLAMVDREADLVGQFEYDLDVLAPATVERVRDYFQALLAAIAHDPDIPIHQLPLLTDAERRRLLVDWNTTAAPYPAAQTVADLFEAQVARAPDAVALVSGGQTLSYADLNARANRLAHLLQDQGVGPETLVGVCLPRSTDLLVAILAILKAGGAYLPLNPSDPPDRLAFMLADADAALVVTHSALAGRLPSDGPPRLALDSLAAELMRYPATNPPRQTTPEGLIYVIYTSGSTGRPKGVAVAHRSVVRLVCGADYLDFGPDHTWLHLAPITFDASSLEIWGALLHGGRLVLAPDGLPDFSVLEDLLRRHSVDTLWLTSSLFNQFIETQPQALRGVKRLLVGGEALSVRHIRLALDRLPDTALINGYGPTETTTFACCYPIPRPLAEDLTSIPIGRPISNTTAYVLDAAGELAPIGVPGELVIGGPGVARGYLNRPDLTAECFVADPFVDEGRRTKDQAAQDDGGRGTEDQQPQAGNSHSSLVVGPSSRLYRTGDRVRWREDGTLEFLGRLDDQVKIRGFRIEPGEVETGLAGHPALQACVVLAHPDALDELRLVAYYVPHADQTVSADELRAFLRRSLPEYMIPSAWVELAELPLNSNGKVDRQALPLPDADQLARSVAFVAPRTPEEEGIAAIWSAVLGVAQVGVHDNFFDLGGHSLRATQVVARIRQAFQTELPLRALFEAPTVAGLAARLPVTAAAAQEREEFVF